MTGLKSIINKIKENINYFQYEKMKNQITLFFFFLLFMVVIFIDLATAKIDFVVGDVSNRDIVAPKTISYIDEVKDEFDKRRGKEFKYDPLLGDRKPALDYRIR